MKRMVWIPLIAAVVLALSACDAPTGAPVTTTTASGTVATTTAPPDTAAPNGTTAGTLIGEARAREIAVQHAGESDVDVSRFEIELDRDRGAVSYEIEFVASGAQYEYDIDAYSGAVLEAERNDKNLLTTTTYKSAATVALIGEASAKQIALDHAGVKEADISRYHIELDVKEQEYEIEFNVGTVEYDYEIDVYKGTVIKAEKDID